MPIKLIRRKYSVCIAASLILLSICGRASAQWTVTVAGSKGQGIENLKDAQDMLNGTAPSRFTASGQFDTLNFSLGARYSGGRFSGDARFPGVTGGYGHDFALDATGSVYIPMPGTYTFAVGSDDGYRLSVGDFSRQHTGLQAPTNTFNQFVFDEAGYYPVELTYFQHHWRAELELYAAPGSFEHFNDAGANFQLVGASAEGGLSVSAAAAPPSVGSAVPEPASSLALAVCACMALCRKSGR